MMDGGTKATTPWRRQAATRTSLEERTMHNVHWRLGIGFGL
ncbi:uncharacterized protein METZ01_LOCUS334373, partial [marine metagenome]